MEPSFLSVISVHDVRTRVEARLMELLSGAMRTCPPPLTASVLQAIESSSVRLRPMLTVLSAEHFSSAAEGEGPSQAALDLGCAVEMVHAASLILDGLPCMEAHGGYHLGSVVHRRCGEDMALLGIAALLNQAYATVAVLPGLSASRRLDLLRTLTATTVSGRAASGTIPGRKRRDSAAVWRCALSQWERRALFKFSVVGGARAGGALKQRLASARSLAGELSESLRVVDEILCTTDISSVEGWAGARDGCVPEAFSSTSRDRSSIEARCLLRSALEQLDDTEPGRLKEFVKSVLTTALEAA